MRLGFYSPEIKGKDVHEVFAKARAYGFTEVQYNFLTSHQEEMPADFWPGELQQVAGEAKEQTVIKSGVQNTYADSA